MTDRVAGNAASFAGAGLASTDVIRQLRDIEEIRRLKHRYTRCIDLKLWDEVGETFTADATLGTGTSAFGKPVEINGADDIVAFLRARLGTAVLTEHIVSQPEITLDGDSAIGIWSQRETILATRHRMIIASSGFSEETYKRMADGEWRIARIAYARSYEAIMSLDDLPSFKLIAAPDGELSESSAPSGEGPLPSVPLGGPWLAGAVGDQPTAAAADTRR
jgi:hypothetical protein